MTTTSSHRSFRHEAFLHRDDSEFLATVVPFVRAGVEAGQAVLAALTPRRLALLRDTLGADAPGAFLSDITTGSPNPARMMPGLYSFLAEHGGPGRPVRCVGEPVRTGLRPAELVEAQLHEALLNVAVDPDVPVWLRCLYPAAELTEAELAEATRSHPILVEPDRYVGSRHYGGVQHLHDLLGADLPAPPGPVGELALPATAAAVAGLVGRHAAAAGLAAERAWSIVVAAREVAATVPAGAVLRVWTEPAALVCEVRDPRPVDDPLIGRRPPDDTGGPDQRGLWLANLMCDLVQVRSTPAGSTVRLVAWR
jgi:hypothetical protein